MDKKDIPLLLIFISLILILVSIITSELIDKEFWLRVISIVFLIMAIFLTIQDKKKKKMK